MRTMSHPELLSVSRGWVVWVGGKLRRSPPIQPSLHNPTSRVGKAGRATKDKKLINWAAIPVNEWIIQIYLRDEFQFEEEYCSKIFCALNIHQLQDQQPILLKTCTGEHTHREGVCNKRSSPVALRTNLGEKQEISCFRFVNLGPKSNWQITGYPGSNRKIVARALKYDLRTKGATNEHLSNLE